MEDFGYKKQKKSLNNNNLKKKFFLLAVFISFGLFFWIVLKAYHFINNTNPNEIAVINATSSVIKVQKPTTPEEYGNNNNSIYEDILQKKGENIGNYQEVKTIDTAKQPTQINGNNQKSPKNTNETNTKEPNETPKTNPEKTTKNTPQQIKSNIDSAEKVPKKTLNKTPEKSLKNEKSNTIKVQVAAMSSLDLAEEYWQKISKNQAKILKNYQHFIEKIDLNNKGILFRLKIGDFANQSEAEEFCQKFIFNSQKTKADCIILH